MKIKRIVAAVLALCMVGGAFAFNAPVVRDFSIIAEAEEERKVYDIWSYTENSDGTINIVNCSSKDEEIIFPATINGKKVYSVKMINNISPLYKNTIKSAIISEGIEVVGYEAFNGCKLLSSISLPKNLKEIRGYAFAGCSRLTSITIPESVEIIGYGAFNSCDGLSSVVIPESVSFIAGLCFFPCKNLTDLTIMNPNCSLGLIQSFQTIAPSYCTIHGFRSSTAEEYAVTEGHEFEPIDIDDFITITE